MSYISRYLRSIHLEPHNMFSTSGISYDIVIKCYFPGAVCQEDSEIFASIRFSGPAPISAVTKTQYFRQSHKMFVLPDCISDNVSQVLILVSSFEF